MSYLQTVALSLTNWHGYKFGAAVTKLARKLHALKQQRLNEAAVKRRILNYNDYDYREIAECGKRSDYR